MRIRTNGLRCPNRNRAAHFSTRKHHCPHLQRMADCNLTPLLPLLSQSPTTLIALPCCLCSGTRALADNRPRSLSPASASGRTSVRSRSVDRSNDPLGLHVIYDPPADRAVDIVFVHGLGGTSRLSWSWHRDLSLFWPKEWLPLEPGLEDARILTFGYNANFLSPAKDLFTISDFAKDLLVQLKFGSDESAQSLNMGQVSSHRHVYYHTGRF